MADLDSVRVDLERLIFSQVLMVPPRLLFCELL